VTLKEAGIHCASFGGKFGWHIMRLLDFFVEKECGNDIHDAIYALEGSFDQPCMVAAYGLLKKWVDEEWLVPDFLNVSPNDARIPVFTGQAASIIEGGWLEGALIAAEQDLSNYDIFLPPTDQTPKRYPAFPEQWMIPAAAKNVEAAGKFVDFITSPETQNAFPTPFGGTATIGYNNDCEKMPHDCTWAGILGSDRETYLLTDQAYTKELADGFFEVQADVISGRLSPEDAAKAMQKKAADYTAKNPK
jgi:raffinose/stachyose/melibiose transport system substrate-binding protein